MHLLPLHTAIPLSKDKKSQDNGPRLKKAAHEFEATLIEQLLKPMQDDPLFGSSSSQSSDSLSGGLADGGMDTVTSMSTQALAQAMANRGGLGIAAIIMKEVHAQKANTNVTAPVKLSPLRGSTSTLHSLRDKELLPWSSARELPVASENTNKNT